MTNLERRVYDDPAYVRAFVAATKVMPRKGLTTNRSPVCAGTRRTTENAGSRACTALLAVWLTEKDSPPFTRSVDPSLEVSYILSAISMVN